MVAYPEHVPVALRTRSIEQAEEHIAGVFVAHRLLCAAREIDLTHHRLDRPRLSLNRLRYGTELVVDAPALERYYLLQLTVAGSCEIEIGRRTVTARQGELVVINPTRPYRKRWSADCVQFIARLDRELLEEAWTARHDRAPGQPLEFVLGTLPRAAALRIEGALRTADRRNGADRVLADALVAALPPEEADDTVPAATRIVRRAEAFMDAHLAHDLSVGDIAQASGTTARTLERSFQRERDATVVAALRHMRLQRARAALLGAHAGTSVTGVAAGVGLTHAGRFALEYRRAFGESPSHTLRSRRAS